MKIETTKQKISTYYRAEKINITVTTILVDGIEICKLTPIKNATKEGYDSRVKFTVDSFKNELGLKFIYSGARTIKQVIKELEYQIKSL